MSGPGYKVPVNPGEKVRKLEIAPGTAYERTVEVLDTRNRPGSRLFVAIGLVAAIASGVIVSKMKAPNIGIPELPSGQNNPDVTSMQSETNTSINPDLNEVQVFSLECNDQTSTLFLYIPPSLNPKHIKMVFKDQHRTYMDGGELVRQADQIEVRGYVFSDEGDGPFYLDLDNPPVDSVNFTVLHWPDAGNFEFASEIEAARAWQQFGVELLSGQVNLSKSDQNPHRIVSCAVN